MTGEVPRNKAEKPIEHIFAVMDALHHGRHVTTLTPAAYHRFKEEVSLHAALQTSGVGELMVQFFIAESPEDFADHESLKWLALHYDFVRREGRIDMQTKGLIIPEDPNRDLLETEFSSLPTVILQWQDIDWENFNPDRGMFS